MTILTILLPLLGALVLGLLVLWSVWLGIAPMPTSPKAKRALMAILPEDVSGTIYELGCGWGGLASALAAHYPDKEVVALERSPIPYLFSKARFFLFPQKNLVVRKVNFFDTSLDEAGLVVCYLFPGAMHTLKGKFEAELKAGTWIVSNTFALPGVQPVKTLEVNDLYRTKIYLYQR